MPIVKWAAKGKLTVVYPFSIQQVKVLGGSSRATRSAAGIMSKKLMWTDGVGAGWILANEHLRK